MLDRKTERLKERENVDNAHKMHKCDLKVRELKGSKALRNAIGGFSGARASKCVMGTQACFGAGSWIR